MFLCRNTSVRRERTILMMLILSPVLKTNLKEKKKIQKLRHQTVVFTRCFRDRMQFRCALYWAETRTELFLERDRGLWIR